MRSDINLKKHDIFQIASNKDVFFQGEQCYTMNMVRDIRTEHLNAGILVTAKVADVSKYHECTVVLHLSGTVKSYSCSCGSMTIWRGACKHIVALLFSFVYLSQEDERQVIHKRNADALIKEFERKAMYHLDCDLYAQKDEDCSVRLVAELQIHYDMPYCSLYIGRDRLYVVKDIEELIGNIDARDTVSYGKSFSIKHDIWAFNQESRKLIDLLNKQIQSIYDLGDDIFHYVRNRSTTGRSIPLTGNYIDPFFEIYENSSLRIRLSEYKEWTLTDSIPDFDFDLRLEPDAITLTLKEFDYNTLKGENFGYFLGHGKIHRIPISDFDFMNMLIHRMSKGINKSIVFSGANKDNFSALLLPKLNQLGLLKTDIDLLSYPVVTKLYLDYEGKNVICKPKFVYGENIINPFVVNNTDVGRNKLEEYKVLKLLEIYGFEEDWKKALYVLSGEQEIYNFYRTGLATLNSMTQVFATDTFSKKSIIPPKPTAKLGIRISGNLLELSVGLEGYNLGELAEALGSYESKKKYHRLKDGRFIDLQDSNVMAIAELVSELNINKKDIKGDTVLLPKYNSLRLEEFAEEKPEISAFRDQNFKQLIDDFKSKSEDIIPNFEQTTEDIPLPDILRNYQKFGYKWLKTLSYYEFGGILADEMGLGKTVQIIALLLSERDNPNPSIVISPTSLAYNWECEFRRFGPEIKTAVLAGTAQKRKEILESSETPNVLITTYDMLKRDIAYYKDIEFQFIIADEAQYIKNPQTQNATSIKQLNGKVRFALTGTPIENSLLELWSIFDFIMPGYLYSTTKFSKLYDRPIVKNNDTEVSQKLKGHISPFILRRLKKDVLTELPDKLETTLYAEMEEIQKKIYTAFLLQARGELDNWDRKDNFAILSQLTRLRQICCHPSLFLDNYRGGSGKLDMTMETICSGIESGHRILLFSQFTSMLDLIKPQLKKNNISHFYLDGSTSAKERGVMVENFNAGENDIFLISLKAGGTGLNLVGADIVIHYDQWWNPAVMQQASDRAHRYGQTKKVQIINMITKDSIEEKIMELQSHKKDLVDSVIQEGGTFINKMSLEEIKELFSQ